MLALRRRTQPAAERSDAIWRLGYLDHVTLAKRTRSTPWIDDVVTDLCAHPSARFLRTLTFAKSSAEIGETYGTCLDALAAAAPRALETLVIGPPTDRVELSHREATLPATLMSALPALRRLVVRSGRLELAAPLVHPGLRGFQLVIDDQAAAALAVIAVSELPALRVLTLDVGGQALPAEVRERCSTTRSSRGSRRSRCATRATRRRSCSTSCASRSSTTCASLDLAGGDSLRRRSMRRASRGCARSRGSCSTAIRRRGARVTISVAAAHARAYDDNAIRAAHEIARWRRWSLLGRDDDRVWAATSAPAGEYQVFANLVAAESGCNCASDKRPCRQALALLFLAANGHAFRIARCPRRSCGGRAPNAATMTFAPPANEAVDPRHRRAYASAWIRVFRRESAAPASKIRRYVPSGAGGLVASLDVLGVAAIAGVAAGVVEGLVDQWFSLLVIFPMLIGSRPAARPSG